MILYSIVSQYHKRKVSDFYNMYNYKIANLIVSITHSYFVRETTLKKEVLM